MYVAVGSSVVSVSSSLSLALGTDQRVNSNDVFNIFGFQTIMVSIHIACSRCMYSPLSFAFKVGVLISIQSSMLSSATITKPVRVVLCMGMISELLAALVSLFALLQHPAQKEGVTAQRFSSA